MGLEAEALRACLGHPGQAAEPREVAKHPGPPHTHQPSCLVLLTPLSSPQALLSAPHCSTDTGPSSSTALGMGCAHVPGQGRARGEAAPGHPRGQTQPAAQWQFMGTSLKGAAISTLQETPS